MFRDLAAPFGVAVFVPMFTNQITAQIAEGTSASIAAVNAVRRLAAAEIVCVVIGIGVVRLLPKIQKHKGDQL